MAKKQAHGGHAPPPPGADDLRRIKGIGPIHAEQLYSAGITLFAQLAALSPDEILAQFDARHGLTAARIAHEDWAGQARALAGAPASDRHVEGSIGALGEPAAEDAATAGPMLDLSLPDHHHASFAITLSLNADNTVSRTRIRYQRPEGGEEHDAWLKWDGVRLLRFLVRHGQLKLPMRLEDELNKAWFLRELAGQSGQLGQQVQRELSRLGWSSQMAASTGAAFAAALVEASGTARAGADVPAETTESAPVAATSSEAAPSPLADETSATGPRLRRLELVREADGAPQRFVAAHDPERYRVMLDLNVADLLAAGPWPRHYEATVYGRPLAGGPRRRIAQSSGPIPIEGDPEPMSCQPLAPSGLYRLEADLELDASGELPHHRAFTLEGDLVCVY